MSATTIGILYIIFVATALLGLYVYGEIRIYRKGGDVYEWTKKLSNYLANRKSA